MIYLLDTILSSDVLLYIFIIFLIVLSMMMVYLVHAQNKELTQELILREKKEKENFETKNKELDLKELTKELEMAPKEKNINLTSYEQEQEDKAIISYEELLNANRSQNIAYTDTDSADDIIVKKVDLENTGQFNIPPVEELKESQPVTESYEHEEEFLSELKQLQSLIN